MSPIEPTVMSHDVIHHYSIIVVFIMLQCDTVYIYIYIHMYILYVVIYGYISILYDQTMSTTRTVQEKQAHQALEGSPRFTHCRFIKHWKGRRDLLTADYFIIYIKYNILLTQTYRSTVNFI